MVIVNTYHHIEYYHTPTRVCMYNRAAIIISIFQYIAILSSAIWSNNSCQYIVAQYIAIILAL